MGSTAMMVVLFPVVLLLAFLFGRNAMTGLRTGVIYAQSYRIERSAQPFNFWFAFVSSAAFSALSVALLGVLGWAIVALR